MRAVVFKDFGEVDLVDVPKPVLAEPTDALVRVTTAAICGSDLHVVHGRIPGMSPGGILGHEFVGVVEAVGAGVHRFAEGDRVVGSFMIPCGACWYCERRHFSRCPDQRVFGYGSFLGDVEGAQADYVLVPNADLVLHHLDELDERRARDLHRGHLHDRDSTARPRLASNRETLLPSSAVVPSDLMAILAARHFRPSTIYAVDTVSQRLEMAQTLGAVPVDADAVHAPSFIQDRTGGPGR